MCGVIQPILYAWDKYPNSSFYFKLKLLTGYFVTHLKFKTEEKR